MTWRIVGPPGYKDYFDNSSENVVKIDTKTGDATFDYTSPAQITFPPTKHLYCLVNVKTKKSATYEKFISFCSAKHNLYMYHKGSGVVQFYHDSNLLNALNSGLAIGDAYQKLYFDIDIESGIFKFYVNGTKTYEYSGDLLGKEPVSCFYIRDPSNSFSSVNLNYIILSDEYIPMSASVKTVTPEVETDWEKNADGSYQTAEVGKTMKLTPPDNCASEGKKLVYSAPFLDKAVGGGDIKEINASSATLNKDFTLSDIEKAVGFLADDNVVFTTK